MWCLFFRNNIFTPQNNIISWIYCFCFSSMAGTIIVCSGCLTLIFTLRRKASTMDVIFWAIPMRASSSASMTDSSTSG